MDIQSFLTLSKIVLEKKLEAEVALHLGIKPSSVRRELNRIIIFYCFPGSGKQKRSGKKRINEYYCAMCNVVKRSIRRFCFTPLETERVVIFTSLDEALAYTHMIFYICCLVWDCGYWNVYIPKKSDFIIPCLC